MSELGLRMLRAVTRGAQGAMAVLPPVRWWESRTLARYTASPPPPVFVLGPPRCGSTHLVQLLAGHTQCAYLTNLASLVNLAPVAVTRVGWRAERRTGGDQRESRYGYVPGLWAPSEARGVIERWLPAGESPGPSQVDHARRAVDGLSRIMGGPFLCKNLPLVTRLEVVHRVFPEALYVRCRRDPRFVAQSILHGRESLHGTRDAWFSVRPPGLENTKDMDAFEQVARQVHGIEGLIDRGVDSFGLAEQVLDLSYETLCADPALSVDRVRSFYRERTDLEWAAQLAPWPAGASRDRVRLSDAEWQRLEEALRRAGSQ